MAERTFDLHVRLLPDEQARWQRAAYLRGQTLSEFIRAACDAAIGDPLPPGDPSAGDSGGPTWACECGHSRDDHLTEGDGHCTGEVLPGTGCICAFYRSFADKRMATDDDLTAWRPVVRPPYDQAKGHPVTVDEGIRRAVEAQVEADVLEQVAELAGEAVAEARHTHLEDVPDGMPEALAAAGFRVTDRPRRPVGLPEVVEAVDHLRVVLGEWLDIIERDE